MKKILLAFLLIFALCSVGSAEIKNSPDGFRGIKWEQSPAALGKNSVRLSSEDKLSLYLKNDDELKIGGADLMRIVYCFWENKFMQASIYAEGVQNTKALKAVMIARYGEPNYRHDTDTFYIWSDDNAFIIFMSGSGERDASAAIASTRLLKAKMEQEEEAAEKGVKDF